jgi:hypothetical protein
MCLNSARDVCTESSGTEWNGVPLLCKQKLVTSASMRPLPLEMVLLPDDRSSETLQPSPKGFVQSSHARWNVALRSRLPQEEE